MMDLFEGVNNGESWVENISPGVVVLRQFAVADALEIYAGVEDVSGEVPFRHMRTPGGLKISGSSTNCGDYGWVSDERGYRYSEFDPQSGKPWPELPLVFTRLAIRAAEEAGYAGFCPDACLINVYEPGTKMSLHQDKDERDFSQPIVSLSLGVPALFHLGGRVRGDRPVQKIPLMHGDVMVFGGEARLLFHGVASIKDDYHSLTGQRRINLTFRKAC